jgi:hypothetical protein
MRLSIIRFVSLLSSKITQPHLSMNNLFPPINGHSRPPSEDLHGVSSGGVADIHSASKQQQIRRPPQTMDQQRRSPLRIIYRSSDYAWNDHPNKINVSNQPVRAASPIKTKLSASARHLANGILHESNANSMLHLPTSSSSIVHQDVNNGNLQLSSATKARQTTRLQRTNSHLDKAAAMNNYGTPMRSESYRSSRLDYNLRPRHTSSKQRSYVNSKSTFHDVNGGEYSTQDENTYHQPPQINMMGSTQRINGSSFDLTGSRKTLSPSKTNTFNIPTQHNYYNSTQELQRTGTTIDKNHLSRFTARDTTSKEQLLTTPKYRQTSIIQAVGTTPTVAAIQTSERHPSAQSYKSRDPNVSYAYNDVKKYIEENDLMSPEKEQTIRNWVIDVDKYLHQLQKIE